MSVRKLLFMVLAAVVITAAWGSSAFAQGTASVKVTVLDPLGARIQGAKVSLHGEDAAATKEATSDAQGEISFDGLASGRYWVEASAEKFQPRKTAPVYVGSTRVALDVSLPLGPLETGVTVTAAANEVLPSQVGAPVTVLDSQTMTDLGKLDVFEGLRLSPGASVIQSGGRGGVTSLFIRGGNSNFTKLLVDGIPANDVGGGVDFAQYAFAGVSQVELLRQANSVAYGSDVVSSVVSLTSPRGRTETPEITISANGGNLRTFQGSIALAGAYRRADYFSEIASLGTDNDLPNNKFENKTYAGRFGVAAGRNTDISATIRLNSRRFETPNAMPFFGVPDNDSVQTDRNYLFGLTAQSQLSEKWSGVLRFGATNRRLLFDNPLLSGSGGLGNVVTIAGANGYSTTGQAVLDFGAGSFPSRNARQGVYLQTTYLAAPGVTVSGGANYEREQNFPDFTSPADAERNNKGFWTEGRVMLFNRISATGGVNFSHIERYDSAWSPRGSFAFFVRTPDTQDLIGDTRVTLNIGRGLKAVSITAVNNSLYRLLVKTPSGAALAQSAGIGPILPERSRTFDVGVEQGLWKRRVRARVAYFDNEYFDLIEFVGPSLMAQFGLSPEVIAAASSGARLNASSFKARGVETSAEAFFNGFRMSGSYTFLDATTTQSFQSSALFPAINPNIPGVPIGAFSPLIGERPFRRPAHTGNMMVSYTRGKGAITLSGYFVGKSDDSTFLSDASFGNTMLLPNQNLNFGYAKMDLSGSYQIHPRVRWHTTIENLLNRDYQPVFGFPALPITFRAGISAVLQGS